VASSAPVGSLLPSSSYLTSGSGLNTPELGNDIDQNQTNISNENSHKKDGVGKMLVQLLTSDGEVNDSGVLSVLRKKKREICVQTGSKYFVCNPILTPNMMEQIKRIEPSLEEPRLSNFLRCMPIYQIVQHYLPGPCHLGI
jgi:hypothetical protein